MQVRAEALAEHLARGVKALYVVHGDEPLLALEAGDAIRAAARAAGATDREVFVAEAGFKWDGFLAANANASLFGDRKCIDLRIANGKPGVEGGKALEAYAANPNPDNITLVTLPRLDRAAQASGWFTALSQAGVTVAVYPVDRDALPGWISARLARQKQRASRDTLAFLADACEGNLLAARQEIEKLALVLPEGELDHAAVEAAVADVARYDTFELSEAWFAGDAARTLRIVRALEAAGESPVVPIWQLSEDLHALAAVAAMVRSGTPAAAAVKNARVWGKRQAALERALSRVAPAAIAPLLVAAARLDALAKGIGTGSVWDELVDAGLALAGVTVAPLPAQALDRSSLRAIARRT
ncbi:MAG: DNA polymerase III subunit delta [Burkholderiales bacterium]|nr:DNA polymerase III subunit delta [Burkholderiales bacterium]